MNFINDIFKKNQCYIFKSYVFPPSNISYNTKLLYCLRDSQLQLQIQESVDVF